MREMTYNEVYRLEECLKALAEHHNEVSTYFRGLYPKKPFAETLASFEKAVESGKSRIAVVENNEKILGFCKIDIEKPTGKIDYLIVLREARGKGFGDDLMEWAMDNFKNNEITNIEVKVAEGNNALSFYEKYGFRANARILIMK